MAWLDLEDEIASEFAAYAGADRYADALEKYRAKRCAHEAEARREKRQRDKRFLARERASRREYIARHRDDERVRASLRAARDRYVAKLKSSVVPSTCAVCGASFSAPSTAARADGCSPAHRRALTRGAELATVGGVRDTVAAHAKRLGIRAQSIAYQVASGVRTAAEALVYLAAKRGAL